MQHGRKGHKNHIKAKTKPASINKATATNLSTDSHQLRKLVDERDAHKGRGGDEGPELVVGEVVVHPGEDGDGDDGVGGDAGDVGEEVDGKVEEEVAVEDALLLGDEGAELALRAGELGGGGVEEGEVLRVDAGLGVVEPWDWNGLETMVGWLASLLRLG